MPDTAHVLVFIATGWLLNLTPGPDVLYIMNSAFRGGVRAGLVAALGIVGGCFVHVLAAAFGVGALLAASATAFTLLKWGGAAYLVWMGAKLLIGARAGAVSLPAAHAADSKHAPALRAVFRRGFLTNVLNPKVALFFLAFVPQFISPDAPDKAAVFLVLGLLFIVNSLPVNFGYAWVAAKAGARWSMARRASIWLDRVAGLMFVGFGLRLAMADNR
ncbi:MAG: LysE family translocator [Burkholderiaceae bacterium]